LAAVVFEGTSDGTLARGVGHLTSSAAPGQLGNLVLAGHRDTFFRELRGVRAGDVLPWRRRNGPFQYEVESTAVVGPDAVEVLQASGGSTLTLDHVLSVPVHRKRARSIHCAWEKIAGNDQERQARVMNKFLGSTLSLVLLAAAGCSRGNLEAVEAANGAARQELAGRQEATSSQLSTRPPVVLASGTAVRVRLAETLDTKRNRAGDRFSATLDEPLVIGEPRRSAPRHSVRRTRGHLGGIRPLQRTSRACAEPGFVRVERRHLIR